MAASTAKWRSSLWDLSHKQFTLYKVYCQLLYIHIYSILSSSITTTLALLCWLECLLHSSCLMFWLKISQKVSMICSLPKTGNNCFSPLTKKTKQNKNTHVFSISDCETLTLDLYYALQKLFFHAINLFAPLPCLSEFTKNWWRQWLLTWTVELHKSKYTELMDNWISSRELIELCIHLYGQIEMYKLYSSSLLCMMDRLPAYTFTVKSWMIEFIYWLTYSEMYLYFL